MARGRNIEAEELQTWELVDELEFRDYNFAKNATDEEIQEQYRVRSLGTIIFDNLDVYSESVFNDVVEVFEARDLETIKIFERILKK